jgi:uncharacterized membrane protein
VDGRPIMVVVGAHFLLRGLDLERFVLYVVKVSPHYLVSALLLMLFLF